MRAVAVAFNVYVSNRAGSEAMGLYSLLGSVYGFGITLGTAGINLGTTRLISDALGEGNEALAKSSVKKCLLYCLVSGGTATLLLFGFADPIGIILLGDARTVLPLRILAITLIPIAICSCLSGYFTAVRRVKVNAAFQVLTQFVKIAATVFFLSFLLELGVREACIALVLGGAVAEFVSLIITYALYRYDRRKLKSQALIFKDRGISKKLLSITLPVTFSACIRSALTAIQHVLVPRGLKSSGLIWAEALSKYGYLHGMALPVILFPSAFISAFAGLLIPEVSECCIQNDVERLRRTSYRALSLSLFFSIGISGIMIFFSRELGLIIYDSEEVALYIRILAPLIPVMYIDSSVDAILKGSGHQVYSMNVNIADALTSCIFALTLIPRLGIYGYIISIYATELMNTTLSLYKMFSVSKMRPKIMHQVFMPILCIIGATNGVKLVLSLFKHPFADGIELTLHIILTLSIYIVLLFATRTVGREEGEFLYASLLSEKSYNLRFRENKTKTPQV